MPSFSTTYTCAACGKSSNVEVTDLPDPYQSIPERSQEVLRQSRMTQNRLGAGKAGDPVDELARDLLEQSARNELRHATCPACNARNPEGVEADKADHFQSMLFGLGFFAIVAIAAWFYPWAALILPGIDLLVFRPMMFSHARKEGGPFPIAPFVAGIALDVGLICLILLYPRTAPFVPIAGIVQSVVRRGTAKSDWKCEEAQKKLRFEEAKEAVS